MIMYSLSKWVSRKFPKPDPWIDNIIDVIKNDDHRTCVTDSMLVIYLPPQMESIAFEIRHGYHGFRFWLPHKRIPFAYKAILWDVVMDKVRKHRGAVNA